MSCHDDVPFYSRVVVNGEVVFSKVRTGLETFFILALTLTRLGSRRTLIKCFEINMILHKWGQVSSSVTKGL